MPLNPSLPQRLRALAGPFYVYGFSAVKWPLLRQCFAGQSLRPLPLRGPLNRESTVLLWGATELPEYARDCRCVRIEDGFLRSVGLGVDLTWPLSWSIDATGVHFDDSRPSDLELILANNQWTDRQLQRAAALRDRVVARGLTKYNTGGTPWRAPRTDRPIHLVIGQVPTDAAVRVAGPDRPYNLALLRAVRAAHPEAYLIYKIHPDVVAGMRRNEDALVELQASCDEVLTASDLVSVFDQVDAVHVATSLAGFEALLRGIPVHCHGRPFYSGWGLTVDHAPATGRRYRALTLDALVHGALIDYPVYFARGFFGLATPEDAVARLAGVRPPSHGQVPTTRRVMRAVLRRMVGVR